MNQLAVYYSDDDSSPYRRNSLENAEVVQSNNDQSTSKATKAHERNERRRNSEYWTDESMNESSPSNSSPESHSNAQGVKEPPRKKISHSAHSNHEGTKTSFHKPQGSAVNAKHSITITQSQTSLVSYGTAEDDDDQFAQADRIAVSHDVTKEDYSTSTNREPKPPRGHQDSQSPDEIAVSVIEECPPESDRRRLVQVVPSADVTPKSNEGSDSPLVISTEVRMPPPPPEKCSRSLEDKFRLYFAKKATGSDLNAMIKNRRDYKNPSMYEKLIEKFEVDELGSNFLPTVFNPHGFSKDCFYDQISILQKAVMEKYSSVSEKKAAANAAAVASTAAAKHADAKRKSRFEGSKK